MSSKQKIDNANWLQEWMLAKVLILFVLILVFYPYSSAYWRRISPNGITLIDLILNVNLQNIYETILTYYVVLFPTFLLLLAATLMVRPQSGVNLNQESMAKENEIIKLACLSGLIAITIIFGYIKLFLGWVGFVIELKSSISYLLAYLISFLLTYFKYISEKKNKDGIIVACLIIYIVIHSIFSYILFDFGMKQMAITLPAILYMLVVASIFYYDTENKYKFYKNLLFPYSVVDCKYEGREALIIAEDFYKLFMSAFILIIGLIIIYTVNDINIKIFGLKEPWADDVTKIFYMYLSEWHSTAMLIAYSVICFCFLWMDRKNVDSLYNNKALRVLLMILAVIAHYHIFNTLGYAMAGNKIKTGKSLFHSVSNSYMDIAGLKSAISVGTFKDKIYLIPERETDDDVLAIGYTCDNNPETYDSYIINYAGMILENTFIEKGKEDITVPYKCAKDVRKIKYFIYFECINDFKVNSCRKIKLNYYGTKKKGTT